MRRQLRGLEKVPLIYFGPDQRVTMEDIPKYSLKALALKNRQKFLPHEAELKEVVEEKRIREA